jgi:hypothetical protein
MDRFLRFGLEVPPLAVDGGATERGSLSLTDAALAAERAGIGALWLPESVPVRLDPVPLAGALAVATTTIGIGLQLRPGHGRHPSIIARDATAIDLLSRGRALVALVEDGAGSLDLDRLGEAAALLRRLLHDEGVTESGRFYEVAELTTRPRPFQPGGPPIVAGVLTEPADAARPEEVVVGAAAAAYLNSGPPGALAASRRRLDAVAPPGGGPLLLWRGELPADTAAAVGTVEEVLAAGADGMIAVLRTGPSGGSLVGREALSVLEVLAPFAGRSAS